MKTFSIFLFVLLLIGCRSQDYTFESRFFDCIETVFADQGVDVKNEMAEFEKSLIDQGILTDNSGESYYQIYETIEHSGDIDFTFEYAFFDSLKIKTDNIEQTDLFAQCSGSYNKLINDPKYMQSRIYKLKTGLDSIRDIESVSSIASIITDILTPEDFTHSYYKMTALLLLTVTNNHLTMNFPKSESLNIDKRNLLNVNVTTKDDSVFLNGKQVSIQHLPHIVTKYIMSDNEDPSMPELEPRHIDLIGDCLVSKLVISLQGERAARYATYVWVQEKLQEAYTIVRNRKSLEYFDSEYENLSPEQQEAINELIPDRISQVVPSF